jgi:TonB family protein
MRPAWTFLAVVGTLVAARLTAQVTIAGHVRDAGGLGISGAEVRVAGSELAATTDQQGGFRLRGVPATAARLSARRLGYRPVVQDLPPVNGAMSDLVIVLDVAPVPLAQVTVTERREPFDPRLAGFRERMLKHVGHFISKERIEDSNAPQFTDLLRGMPGLTIGRVRGTNIPNSVRLRGSLCPPIVFIDGFAATAGEFDLDVINLGTVEGVEIYNGTSTVPAELNHSGGGDRCGVIAIWSRPYRKPKQKPAQMGELLRETEAAAVYFAEDVDSAARVIPESFATVYPDSLWRRAMEGYARVEFVVDTTGHPEMEFFSIVSESHGGFGDAVRDAVEGARFVPAVRRQRKVRQVVYLPVRFEKPAGGGVKPGL